METVGQNVLVVVAVVVVSLLFMAGLNAIWPVERHRHYNDLVGWQLTVLGTAYGVILGFMLLAVWTTYGEADLNVAREASAVQGVYRLAEALPEPQATQLQVLARSYAETAINRDWPQMASNQEPKQTDAIDAEMWKTVMLVRAASPIEQASQEHEISELRSLAEHRLIRLSLSSIRLPNVLWCVLVVGGALTIISACTFGVENRKLQALEVVSLSLLISLSLVAIANIHHPFQGPIHVRSYAFERVLQSMNTH